MLSVPLYAFRISLEEFKNYLAIKMPTQNQHCNISGEKEEYKYISRLKNAHVN